MAYWNNFSKKTSATPAENEKNVVDAPEETPYRIEEHIFPIRMIFSTVYKYYATFSECGIIIYYETEGDDNTFQCQFFDNFGVKECFHYTDEASFIKVIYQISSIDNAVMETYYEVYINRYWQQKGEMAL